MSPDLPCLALLALGAAGGAASGALRQVVHLLSVALAAVLARPGGELLEAPMRRVVSPALARPLGAVLAFGAALALFGIAGGLLLRGRARGRARSPADMGLGALLGGAQAALFLWAALSLLVLWDRPVGPRRFRLDPRHGDLAAVAREHNLLDAAAPGKAQEVREKLPAVREALEAENPIEKAQEAAREAVRAQERRREALEKAAR
ncbi:MAG TPA: CvpA family protein [Anaeromyxobacteraceae bacterium]